MIYLQTQLFVPNIPTGKQMSPKRKEGDRTFIHGAEYNRNYFSSLPMQLPKYYIPRVEEKSRETFLAKTRYKLLSDRLNECTWPKADLRKLLLDKL